MFDDSGREAASLTDFPIGGVMFELKREEFERKPVKIPEGRVTRAPIIAFHVRASWNLALRKHGFAQLCGKV